MTTMDRRMSIFGPGRERLSGRRPCRSCAPLRSWPPRCWRSITCPRIRRSTSPAARPRLSKCSSCRDSSSTTTFHRDREMAEEIKHETLPVAADAPLATIATLSQHEGKRVTLHGWLYNLRASGKLLFPIFRDGTGTVQGIVPKAAVTPEVFERVRGLTQESSVVVTGRVRADTRAPGGYELDVENVEVLQRVSEEEPFPISLKEP